MTTPSSITEVAVRRAIQLLQAAKAEYAIRLPDGQSFGELPIAETKKRTVIKVNKFKERMPDYIEQIKGMQPGDVLRWSVGQDAEAFRKAVSSTASHYIGKGKCMSTLTGEDKGTVEILRVE